MKNIYLIGMRGSGKTTIAKLLAQELGLNFVDMDQVIREREQQSIVEIVEANGWDTFREKERDIVHELAGQQDQVVGTGGGVLMYFDNAEQLKSSGTVILLVASPEVLAERIEKESDRPSLTGQNFVDEITTVWKERQQRYEAAADLIVQTDTKTPEQIVDEILSERSLQQETI